MSVVEQQTIFHLFHFHRPLFCFQLDKAGNVKLSDFGLCKPPGLSDKTFVGTPVHMAPEIIKQLPYSESVDVFAFGILLWYICEGEGNHPKYVMGHTAIQGLLVETAIGRRPERLSQISDSCWELMNKCWMDEPICRPSIGSVIDELQSIIMDSK